MSSFRYSGRMTEKFVASLLFVALIGGCASSTDLTEARQDSAASSSTSTAEADVSASPADLSLAESLALNDWILQSIDDEEFGDLVESSIKFERNTLEVSDGCSTGRLTIDWSANSESFTVVQTGAGTGHQCGEPVVPIHDEFVESATFRVEVDLAADVMHLVGEQSLLVFGRTD